MIKVTIKRNSAGKIDSFTMSGHAEFDEPGKDIVCAGASAIAFGTINSIYVLCKVEPSLNQEKKGFLHCQIPHLEDDVIMEKVQLLLEGMIVSFQTIELDYGQYIKINS
ncbi:ribosomal-processing cysteine protease Prp [Fredinandcohnia quinoae]|uniref:Ribosomal processing cysteine protease Prp n=1 Tax=Fredinandcohnia quinoae TaxID=2918902 RepID=A0AAW5E0W2_9BACI|nr:ribosomal-processing cysteine protease Prp [Fredinandcohnia sp. SECRCQ15]MCH1626552.1 ribosomal-processing cysteine protease Prp [Fredinandcohnia sp. SECRCQ15]